MSSAIVRVLLLLLSGFLLFLFLLWLLWPRLSKLCWIVVVRVGTLVLFLTLEDMLSIFHHWVKCLLWVYHIWLLLCWGMFLLWLLSGGFFFKIINGCWILSKAFSASTEIIIPKQSWERRMELEESTCLTSDYTTKPQSSREYGTGTKTEI